MLFWDYHRFVETDFVVDGVVVGPGTVGGFDGYQISLIGNDFQAIISMSHSSEDFVSDE